MAISSTIAIVSTGALIALAYVLLSRSDGQNSASPPSLRDLGTQVTSTSPPPAAEDPVHTAVSPSDGARTEERQTPAFAREMPADQAGPHTTLAECPAAMQLVGSVVNVAKPERSLAAVHLRGGTRVARPGATLGGYELVAVGRRRAYFRGPGGSACELRAASSTQTSARPDAAPRAVSPNSAPGEQLSPEQLKGAVRQLDGRTYAVSRAVLAQALANPAMLRRAGRFRPTETPNGPKGLALTRIAKGSVLNALGLQKGDVLTQLNGNNLSDVGGAVRALRALRADGRVSLALSRNGTAQELTYIVN